MLGGSLLHRDASNSRRLGTGVRTAGLVCESVTTHGPALSQLAIQILRNCGESSQPIGCPVTQVTVRNLPHTA